MTIAKVSQIPLFHIFTHLARLKRRKIETVTLSREQEMMRVISTT